MRYATARLLLAWVAFAATADAGHVSQTQSPDAKYTASLAWENAFDAPVSFAGPPPECALTGSCGRKVRFQDQCAGERVCAEFPPFFTGPGREPRGYAFGNERRKPSAQGAPASVAIPSTATLLLGIALLVPLLMPRRSRRRRG